LERHADKGFCIGMEANGKIKGLEQRYEKAWRKCSGGKGGAMNGKEYRCGCRVGLKEAEGRRKRYRSNAQKGSSY